MPVRVLLKFWDESLHPRDEMGRWTDAPGTDAMGNEETRDPHDADSPQEYFAFDDKHREPKLPVYDPDHPQEIHDRPTASHEWRAKNAAVRAEYALQAGIEAGDTVNVGPEDWDAVSDDVKAQVEQSWIDDHLSQYEETPLQDWHDNLKGEIKDELEGDEDFAKQVWLTWAIENGYTAESAESAFNGLDTRYNPKTDIDNSFDIDQTELKWNEAEFDSEGADPGQWFINNSEKLNEEYRSAMESEVEDRFENQSQDVPHSVTEQALEDAQQAFSDMSDDDKLGMARDYVGDEKQDVEEPDEYAPLNDDAGSKNYSKTQAVVRYLQEKLAEDVAKERGFQDKLDFHSIASTTWGDWKGSSTSDNGLLLQYATAKEFGGNMQKFTPEMMEKVNKAAVELARDHLDYKLHQGISTEGLTEKGIDLMRAHVHGTWAATQFALHKAGLENVPLYRGIMLPGEEVDKQKVELVQNSGKPTYNQPAEFMRLPEMPLLQYGAVSTSARAGIANNWNGVGQKPPNPTRVVLRVNAPASAIISVPAFGQNVHDEEEVVLAGTKWNSWDLWKDKAPTAEMVPIKSFRNRFVVKLA